VTATVEIPIITVYARQKQVAFRPRISPCHRLAPRQNEQQRNCGGRRMHAGRSRDRNRE